MSEQAEFLRRSELFADMPSALLEAISASLATRHLAAGGILFRRGDPGDAVYLIREGSLALQADGVTLLTRGPAECVGEFALIDDGERSADAVARTDVALLRWGRDDFRHALARDPRIARGVFRLLTAKLREDVSNRVRLQLDAERWRQDLARAREIQTGMLPAGELSHPRLELAAHCSPADQVGGDFFDYLVMDDDRVGILVADVTGHGFYSSLFVAMAKSCLHTQARFEDAAPGMVLDALRHALDLSLQRRLLMSCCYVELDPRQQTLRYANAGHPFPMQLGADGGIGELQALDPPLGTLDANENVHQQDIRRWCSGDLLVMYSDGLVETRDAGGGMFGFDALRALIRQGASLDVATLRDRILERLREHQGATIRDDDLTLVVARAR